MTPTYPKYFVISLSKYMFTNQTLYLQLGFLLHSSFRCGLLVNKYGMCSSGRRSFSTEVMENTRLHHVIKKTIFSIPSFHCKHNLKLYIHF